MKIELTEQDQDLLTSLLRKKIDGTKWVLENKSPDNEDKLKENIKTQEKLLEKLKR